MVLVAEADEERNTADVGMSWLVRERPELVRCDYALNEGGGSLLELADGRRVVTISVGEKLVTSLRIRVHGTAGHASVPDGADNPLSRPRQRPSSALLAHRAPAADVAGAGARARGPRGAGRAGRGAGRLGAGACTRCWPTCCRR